MTTTRLLMGLDVGGSGGHCLLLHPDGRVVTRTSESWTYSPDPTAGPFSYRLDPEITWEKLGALTRRALEASGSSPADVVGVAVTSMRHGLVLVDDGGRALFAAPNRDARGAQAASALAAERGQEFHERTGHWPAPMFPAARLSWLAEHDPEILDRSQAFLAINEWIALRLTGEVATDASQAGESLLFDLRSRDWAWDLIDSLGLPRRIFPPVREAGSPLGALRSDVAGHLGLDAGIPVAVGGADTQCGLLGLGVVDPGQVGVIAGSTVPIQMVVDAPRTDPEARLWTGHHVVPERWVMESNAGGMGHALEWIAKLLHPRSPHPAAALAAEATNSEPGAGGLLSAFGAELFNARSLGFPLGCLALSPMLAEDDSGRRGHLARAVLEGMAFSVEENLEQLIEITGAEIREVRLAGGMTRSDAWSRIVSELSPGSVGISAIPDATALGAAICAGTGAGIFGSLVEGSRLARIDPGPESADFERTRALYEGWRSWRRATEDASAAAGELALGALVEPTSSGSSWDAPASPPRVLVTATLDDEGLATLRRRTTVDYRDYREDMTVLSGEELVQSLEGYEVLVTEVDLVDAEVLAQLPGLRAVFSCRGNPVNVDVDSATALGIPVFHAPGRNADAVADLTVSMMLNLFRRVLEADRFLRVEGEAGDKARLAAAYESFRGHELGQKTIGFIGLGAVGRRVVERLLPFGSRILAHDPFVSSEEVLLLGAEPVSLESLLAQSDCITLHCAVTPETRGLIGAEQLAAMRPGTILINTARAPLVDEEALTDALVSGHLGGAGLDVFAEEPPASDHTLLALPNVIATPHIGGNTLDVAVHQGRLVNDGLEQLFQGKVPAHVVNPESLEGFDWNRPRRVVKLDPARVSATAPSVCDWEGPEAKSDNGADAPRPGVRNLFGLLGRREKSTPTPSAEPTVASGQARDAMSGILGRFVNRLGGDAALSAFAANKDITVHYLLTDIDFEFFTRFRKGVVSGDLGAPTEKPEVCLKMKARTLDRIFTDRLNGTKAALSGKLAFSGDTIKAIKLKRIQPDLNRLYCEVRGAEGEQLESSLEPAVPAATRSLSDAAAPVVADDVRRELIQVVDELYAAELVTSTGGNVSVRTEEGGRELWITPSQLYKGHLSADQLLRIDLEGELVAESTGTPSSERHMHAAILRARPDVGAVVHSHAPQATTLGLAEVPFLPISTEAAFIGDIPLVPFILPGSQDLAERVAAELGSGNAVILQNHGLVVAGDTLRRAADMTKIIEQTAAQILGCLAAGKEPPVLPSDVVDLMREAGDLVG